MAISDSTRKYLWTRARDRCAFPGCVEALTHDGTSASTGESVRTVLGEQAHIRSSKPNGPRHDPDYPKAKLDDYENLILLCPTHHTRIDAHNGAEYDVATLISMRERHENYQGRRHEIETVVRAYLAAEYTTDDKVLFEQVDLHGPSVDAMFVDVPLSCRPGLAIADTLRRISTEHPGDPEGTADTDGQIVTGAAQALLHPDWSGNALLVGGPGQGKSTLLQYVCQFHRARRLGRDTYTGDLQRLAPLTDTTRVPIRIDLRKYARWASTPPGKTVHTRAPRGPRNQREEFEPRWPSLEEYVVSRLQDGSGGHTFELGDLATLVAGEPVLLALDGLDEVANLQHRGRVNREIVATQARLHEKAADLMVLVASRPGPTATALWSSPEFPTLHLQRLSHGLRLQYLQQWAAVAKLSDLAAERLQETFMSNQHLPHIKELASYPMQLAILLHLLHRRQLLPGQRTELYREYLKTFLDREQGEDKEPLLAEERTVIEDIHAILGWHLQTKAEDGTGAGSVTRENLRKLLRAHLSGRNGGLELAEQLFNAFTTRVLCLVERDTGSFQFEVQSLREYFAAAYVFENVLPKRQGKLHNSRDDCLDAMLRRPYWSNACRFFVGMFSRGEVRGIQYNLRALRDSDPELGAHPMLRSIAAQILDDRIYEGQNDDVIREVVDFILEGAGVVLAEDGLLDISGSSLLLAERAGRAQAVDHLKTRLEHEQSLPVRDAAAQCLRRHTLAADDLAGWWWDRYEPSWAWLATAAQLKVLSNLNEQQIALLTSLLTEVTSQSEWVTDLLTRGGSDVAAEGVLAIVHAEINDGAVEAVKGPGGITPVGQILEGASLARLRPGGTPQRSSTTSAHRTRRRRPLDVMTRVADAADQLRASPGGDDNEDGWQLRLVHVIDAWGDGWIVRQAAAAVPHDINLSAIADALRSSHPDLARAAALEAAARDNRDDSTWWRERLAGCADGLDQRHWAFSLLALAHLSVVLDLAAELNHVLDQLAPKHVTVLRQALKAFTVALALRQLNLAHPLRLNQVEFSARGLWVARVVATHDSITQIDKRLRVVYPELLGLGAGEVPEVLRAVGTAKTLPAALLRSRRPALPADGWAASVKVGSVAASLRSEILRDPADWPPDLTRQAVVATTERLAAKTQPVVQVAEADSWFAETAEPA